MKKLFSFVVMFVVHFVVSLIFNWIFGESENIGRMLISSLLFVVVYSAVLYFVGPKRKN